MEENPLDAIQKEIDQIENDVAEIGRIIAERQRIIDEDQKKEKEKAFLYGALNLAGGVLLTIVSQNVIFVGAIAYGIYMLIEAHRED